MISGGISIDGTNSGGISTEGTNSGWISTDSCTKMQTVSAWSNNCKWRAKNSERISKRAK